MVKQIRGADPSNPAVQLGLLCIEQDIPVSVIAERVGVSRQAVYMWFIGLYRPREEYMHQIHELLREYAS